MSSAILLVPALSMAMAPSASPVPGGRIGTLEIGSYLCELPGDASGPAAKRVPEADFSIESASSYRTSKTGGTYLLTGDHMVMTSGPFNGRKFHRESRVFLRELGPDGEPGDMRCVRATRNNS